MNRAKSLFLKFAGEEVLEKTTYGEILNRQGTTGKVYILGVFASEEPNFLFSYNITNLTESMRKKLNRERLNVGRTTYADRVRQILKISVTENVHGLLVEQVEKRATGEQCDELSWIEISQMALTLMHQKRQVAYLTEQELQSNPSMLDNVRSDGYQVVVVTDQQKNKLQEQAAAGGTEVRTLEAYVSEYNTSFQYKFINQDQLTFDEAAVFGLTPKILSLVGLSCSQVPPILISETMRVTSDNTEGVWDPNIEAIVIRRSKLESLIGYAATLLHEVAHATTGTIDATRAFEWVLTNYLGHTASAAINT